MKLVVFLHTHSEIDKNIKKKKLLTKLYDERNDFSFLIFNICFFGGDIPSAPAYRVFISKLIRYVRACRIYVFIFLYRAKQITIKFCNRVMLLQDLSHHYRNFMVVIVNSKVATTYHLHYKNPNCSTGHSFSFI